MKNRDLSSPIEYEVIYKDKIIPVRDKPKKYREPQYSPPKKTYKGGFITMTIIAFLVFVLGVGAAGYLIIAKPEAIFPAANPTYTVMYRNNIGDQIITLKTYENVKKGSTNIPEYQGETPSRPDDASFAYKFNGKWSTNGTLPVNSNIEMLAEYDKIPLKTGDWTVTWNGYDEKGNSKVLDQYRVKNADIAEWDGPDPTRPANGEYTYEFTGWSPNDGRAVTKDMTFTAQFREEKKPNIYHVKWMKYADDGTLVMLDEEDVKEGDKARSMAGPERAPDKAYTYKFKEWAPNDNQKITEDTTFIPQYTKTDVPPEPNIYHVKWLQYNDDGKLEELSDEDIKEGDKVKPMPGPFRKADKAYTYEFDKWLPDVNQKIMEDTTFIPQYNKTEIKPDTKIYTVEWKRYKADGSFEVYKSANVEEGKTAEKVEGPTKASDGAFTYVFKNWSPDDSKPITKDTTFIPEYTRTAIPPAPNKYMVVWKNNDVDGGQIWKAEQLEEGKIPVKPAKDPYKISGPGYRYEFTGWSPATPTAIHENTEYTAIYKKTADPDMYAFDIKTKTYAFTGSTGSTVGNLVTLFDDGKNGPERVTTIGDGKNPISILEGTKTIEIPPYIETIADNAFKDIKVYSAVITFADKENSKLKTVGKSAFESLSMGNASYLYDLPNSVEFIGERAYFSIRGNDADSFNWPENLKILDDIFGGALSRTQYVDVIGPKVEVIEKNALSFIVKAGERKDIFIPENVKTIKGGAIKFGYSSFDKKSYGLSCAVTSRPSEWSTDNLTVVDPMDRLLDTSGFTWKSGIYKGENFGTTEWFVSWGQSSLNL